MLVAGGTLVAWSESAGAAPKRLETAIVDPQVFGGESGRVAFSRTRDAGSRYVRLLLSWRSTAPGGPRKPVGFKADDPNDPRYRWGSFDEQVRGAVASGLVPFVGISSAPEWAEDRSVNGSAGTRKPKPKELALFATAAARRYGGAGDGLPAVRIWQIWNEPNLSLHLTPQFAKGRPVAADWYRGMVNAASAALKSVDPRNQVIAGGLSPFTFKNPAAPGVAPLLFMRRFLCLARTGTTRVCARTARFDIWSHHPYTSGGPTHHAYNPNDVSLGDLPEMRRVLILGAPSIVSQRPVRFWVTEFSWDSNPPDPKGVPIALHARWVAEALYRMWAAGVEVVTWFTLRDDPFDKTPFQSGLYFNRGPIERDRPKPALAAFRFPFVAFATPSGLRVWGRSPDRGKRVLVEYRPAGGTWRRLAIVSPNANGLFAARYSIAPQNGWLRARAIGGVGARPFSLRDPGDRAYDPFGSN